MKDNKITKKAILTFIVLPLLISAVWEKILSPLFDAALELILSLSNSISTSISNRIYTEISNGVTDNYFMTVCSVLLGVFCAITLFTLSESYELYESHNLQDSNDSSPIKDVAEKDSNDLKGSTDRQKESFYRHRFFYHASIVIAVLTHLFCFSFLAEQSYVRDTIQKLTNNIEIVAPYISDIEYKMLKSEFHLIQSRSDYNDLVFKLETIGEQNGLKLK